jgi:UDP-GlcNAc3NAcA epimerase
VKAAPLADALAAAGCEHILVHTGQHWDHEMSGAFFEELNLPEPHVNLGVRSGPHGAQTGEMLTRLEPVLREACPDCVLVLGDTNSTLAGALAAAKLHIHLAHVEAGLRSWNRRMPEELNRVLTDHASDLLFAPTLKAVENLRNEGIPTNRISLTGDIMQDAFLRFAEISARSSSVMQRCGLSSRGYVLATIHRAENTDDDARLRILLDGLCLASARLPVIFPVHPRTRAAMERIGWTSRGHENILTPDPAGYIDMIALETNAAVIATDSGGVQKEAFFACVPCVTLRTETEWTELLEMGWNQLCPPSSAHDVCDSVLSAIGRNGSGGEPYGGGKAASRIAQALTGAGAWAA